MSFALGTDPQPKPWCNLVANSVTSNSLAVSNVNISGYVVSAQSINSTPATSISGAQIRAGACLSTGSPLPTDTGPNIDTAFGGALAVGAVVSCLVVNNTNVAETLQAGAGVTLLPASMVVPASTSRIVFFAKTGAGAFVAY